MKTRKPKQTNKNEIRTHKKNGHPSYIRKQIGSDFICTSLTHAPITDGVKNNRLKKNPNRKDPEPSNALKKVERESVEKFKGKKDGWRIDRKDKKRLNIRDRKKIKKLK